MTIPNRRDTSSRFGLLRWRPGADEGLYCSFANRAAAGLRRSIAPRLGLRRVPELRFHYDSGQDAIDRIETLLGEIERERVPEE